MFRAGLFNFSKGELGPALYGRVDVAAYNAALRQANNVVVLKYGGITRRPGMRVVYELVEPDDGWDSIVAPIRLLPFEFSIEQTYALLFGQATMHPLAAGGAVLEEELLITGVSLAANAVITAAYHGYSVGDEVFLVGIAGAIGDRLNGVVSTVTAVGDTNHFAIDKSTVGLAAFTAATGGITRVAPPDPPPTPPTVPALLPAATPPTVYSPGGGQWTRDGWEFLNDDGSYG